MARLIVVNNISLDGVMQAPGRADEDTRGSFEYGGWALPYSDEVMGRQMGKRMGQRGAVLLGRRTYEDFYRVWPSRTDGNPFTEALNNAQKYVVSNTLTEPLPWRNSNLLKGDAASAVAGLKAEVEGTLTVLGSGELIGSLMDAELVDEYLLMMHPLVLGTGRRLFPGGQHTRLRLMEAVTTTSGVVIATYKSLGTPGV